MNKMTRAYLGIILLLCLLLFVTVATLVVVILKLTSNEDNNPRISTNHTGLPEFHHEAVDVAIVGAGISGSYVAWRMRNAGLSISLFEYSNRIGGRCHTVKFPGIPDVNLEMGSARFLPTEHPLLNKTIYDLGLDVVDFGSGYGGNEDTLYYLRGRRMKYSKLPGRAPYDLDPAHRIDPYTLAWEIFKNYTDVDPRIEGYAVPPKSLFHKSKDGIPLYAQRHTFHRNHHLRAMTKDEQGNFVLNFQPTLTVRGLTSENEKLKVKQVRAKKVLLAISRMALESLDWEVLEHPEIKDYIMNSLTEAKAGKMYFGYNDTWWRNLTLFSPYTISTTPLRQTTDYKVSPSTGKGVLNPMYSDLYTKVWRDSRSQGSFVRGAAADDDTIAMTDVGVDLVKKILADIFNISTNTIKQPDFAVMEIWDQYPFGASWYTWRPRYIFEEVEDKMTRPSPDEDVFIISNTFSKTMNSGWTEGALEIVERTFVKYFPEILD